MLSRATTIIYLTAALAFALAACDGAQPTPTATPVIDPTPVAISVPSPTPTLAPAPTPTPALSPGAASLGEEIPKEAPRGEIPPCTPVPGSPVDPCEPDAPPIETGGIASYIPYLGDEPTSVRDLLDDHPPPGDVTHLVLRGTYLPNTVRCTFGDQFRPVAHLRSEFGFGGGGPGSAI